MPKIYSFCNQKGGVGKTTTAINLAAYLADAGKNVLLIDIDPQGNATSGIVPDIKRTPHKTIYNIITGEAGPPEAIVKTSIENLSIIPSSIQLTGAEVELVGTIGREYKLRKAVSQIKENYDYVFIDCPPSLGLLTINALTAAEAVMIPIQCEYYALEGLSQLMNTISLVRENLNPGLEIGGVVLTMADYRTKLTKEVIDEVKRHFHGRVFDSIIPRSVKLSEAPGFGKPILLYDKHSVGAKMYEGLAMEFLGEKIEAADAAETQKAQSGEDAQPAGKPAG